MCRLNTREAVRGKATHVRPSVPALPGDSSYKSIQFPFLLIHRTLLSTFLSPTLSPHHTFKRHPVP